MMSHDRTVPELVKEKAGSLPGGDCHVGVLATSLARAHSEPAPHSPRTDDTLPRLANSRCTRNRSVRLFSCLGPNAHTGSRNPSRILCRRSQCCERRVYDQKTHVQSHSHLPKSLEAIGARNAQGLPYHAHCIARQSEGKGPAGQSTALGDSMAPCFWRYWATSQQSRAQIRPTLQPASTSVG